MNRLRNKWLAGFFLAVMLLGSIVPASGTLAFCLCSCLCDHPEPTAITHVAAEEESHCKDSCCAPAPVELIASCCDGNEACHGAVIDCDPGCSPCDPELPCDDQEFAAYADAVLPGVGEFDELENLDELASHTVAWCPVFDRNSAWIIPWRCLRDPPPWNPPDWAVALRCQVIRC